VRRHAHRCGARSRGVRPGRYARRSGHSGPRVRAPEHGKLADYGDAVATMASMSSTRRASAARSWDGRATCRAIFRHVRPHHHGIRASRQRLKHRHRRAHAIEPRHIAAGEHDTACAASDDDRSTGEVGPVALLDHAVKGVAIGVDNQERVKRSMVDLARRAARVAPLAPDRRGCERVAIAAQRGHASSSGRHSQAAPRTPLESP